MSDNFYSFLSIFWGTKAMALEEVVMDEDSEDEINVGAGEIEEKRVCTIT